MTDNDAFWSELDALRIAPNTAPNLVERSTRYRGTAIDKAASRELLAEGVRLLSELQDTLYAHSQHGLLVALQGMDTSGKDGAIKHIMSGLNPQGVTVTSFKQPSSEELSHDFLWRHYRALPPRGRIGIHNRSHYENVLVSRVHPTILLNENLPHVQSPDDATPDFWQRRFKMIRQFESIVTRSGTHIIKFYLHLSKEEQKRRLLDRIDDPSKNWKFSPADVRERRHWAAYINAYEEAIAKTSTKRAPWYVIPADDKWYARLAMAAIMYRYASALNLSYPSLDKGAAATLADARAELLAESD
jgi:PPK2 family polyphosphate:nucleotide phosphotransferase